MLRQIVDMALAEPSVHDPEIAAAFATLAESYDALLEGVFDDDPALRIDE